jgi:hypothetical protein
MNRPTHDIFPDTRVRSRGFVLLMVLMLIAASSVVGMSYIYGAQVKTASTINLMRASEARYLAESGLQHGLYALQTRAEPFGSASAPNGPYNVVDGDGGYVFYITSTSVPNDYRIVATGTEGRISQTVSMTVRLTSDYAQKMSDLKPKYWWRLGDSGFTAVDEMGKKDGTYVNGVIHGAEGAILGDANTAAEFRGSNDDVNLGEIDKMDSSRVTFACWARADAWATAYPRLMARGSGTDLLEKRWHLLLGPDRKLRFGLRLKDTGTNLKGSTVLQLGKWYFVVGTFDKDARQMRLYLNGEPNGTKNNTLKEDIKDDDHLEAWVGDCPPVAGQRPWEGSIDEVFIMRGQALTPEQVKELFDASIPHVEVISWDD